MRVAVCGAVGWTDAATIERALDELLAEHGDLVVLTGMADGADRIARRWARRNGRPLWAECLEPGEYPGPMHAYNERLIGHGPDLVLAFKEAFDPAARLRRAEPGTEHLVRLARAAGIATIVQRHPSISYT